MTDQDVGDGGPGEDGGPARGRRPLWAEDALPPPLVRAPTRRVYPRSRGIPIEKAHEVDESVQIALRLGAVLLSGGAPVEEVEAAVFAAASSLGLQNFEVDVTYNAIQLAVSPRRDRTGVSDLRVVRFWWVNHARLIAAHRLVLELVDGRVAREDVEARVAEVEQLPLPYPIWFAALAGSVLASAVVVRLGADVVTALLTLLSAAVIGLLGTFLNGRRVPAFVVNAVAAFLATMIAAGITTVAPDVKESLLIAGSIITLLPGMALLVATREAIGGFPVTAAARLVLVVASSTGIVAGVVAGLRLAAVNGVDMSVDDALASPGAPVLVATLAAAVAAVAAATANQAPPRALAVVAALGALGGLAFAVTEIRADAPVAAVAGAVVIGLGGMVAARRLRSPSVVGTVPAVIPLLPGLGLYLGVLALSQGLTLRGISLLLTTLWATGGLATGAVLGEDLGGWLRRVTRR